jgi:hypothetical protein
VLPATVIYIHSGINKENPSLFVLPHLGSEETLITRSANMRLWLGRKIEKSEKPGEFKGLGSSLFLSTYNAANVKLILDKDSCPVSIIVKAKIIDFKA